MININTQTDLGVTTGRTEAVGRVVHVSQRTTIQGRICNKRRARMPPMMQQESLSATMNLQFALQAHVPPGLMTVSDTPASVEKADSEPHSSPTRDDLGGHARGADHNNASYFEQSMRSQEMFQRQLQHQLQQQRLLQLQLQLQQHQQQHQQYQIHIQALAPAPKRKATKEEEACLALQTLRDITPCVDSPRNIKKARIEANNSFKPSSSIVIHGLEAIDV
jgi:hypothetical protein